MRVNIGCGATPTSGWINFDNSISVRVASIPILSSLLGRYSSGNPHFVKTAREQRIKWANAARHIPLKDESVEVLYSSHMLEHLDRLEVRSFLREAHRVLARSGIIRIGVPDLSKLVAQYINSGDANSFVEDSLLTAQKPRGFVDRIRFLLVGPRHHHWMYDGKSMLKLLTSAGFVDADTVDSGHTRITEPGSLDLWERHEETVYLEARKP